MNGVPLPIKHGFPARLIVPGLYGYVSATKWLSDIELTRFDRYDAYWVQRGWTQQGPIETQSRIDVPTSRRAAARGAGRGRGCGVGTDPRHRQGRSPSRRRTWHEASLADALSADTWRQWVYRWDPTPGHHRLRVRATDGTGALQDASHQPPGPSGATGYHTVYVTVTPLSVTKREHVAWRVVPARSTINGY